MTPTRFLIDERPAIVAAAADAISSSPSRHYATAGPAAVLDRLEALYDVVLEASDSRHLGATVAFARRLAAERFAAGYDLCEVQAACNALEEATWRRLFERLSPGELAEPLTLVSTIFGAVKDTLAGEYVALAATNRAPAPDVNALFAGTA